MKGTTTAAPSSARGTRLTIIAMSITALVLAAGIGVVLLSDPPGQVELPFLGSCWIPHLPSYLQPKLGSSSSGGTFTVSVLYSGQWVGSLSGWNSSTADGPPAFVLNYSGTVRTCAFQMKNWNPYGESTLQVVAHKLGGGNGNLTVTINAGFYNLVNSTLDPFGSVSVSEALP